MHCQTDNDTQSTIGTLTKDILGKEVKKLHGFLTLVVLNVELNLCKKITMYLLSFHNTEITHVVEILPLGGQGPAGVGATKWISRPLFRHFPIFFSIVKTALDSLNHIHIWQVSAQLSCGDGDIGQIRMWLKNLKCTFARSKKNPRGN